MLSIVILTNNEEQTIADCIESLSGLGDEILVIDASSTDRTIEIAKHLKARVIPHEFKNFSDQRNFGMMETTGAWVLYIDADEQTTPGFKKEILETIQAFDQNSGIGGYFIRRKTYFYGKDWGLTDKMQRLFYKPLFKKWHGEVHETAIIEGKFGEIYELILHFTHSDLSRMVEKTNSWSEFEADLRLKTSHPKMSSWRFIRVMVTGFIYSYFWQKGYKNGTYGFIEAMYQSFSMFITYAKLWEKQKEKKKIIS